MPNSRVLDVWLISCDAAAEDSAYGVLQEAEKQRVASFVFPEHRRRYIQAHSALRQILSRYTGVAPGAIRFVTGKSGKPSLENQGAMPVSFNMSHSGEIALVAAGSAPEIGVDIESVRPMSDWEEIARLSFHPAELEWVRKAAGHRRAEAFFQVWTAKEAYIKACGKGMSHPLDSFAVVGPAQQQEYVITRLELPQGYEGAVAYSPPKCEVRLKWWRGPDASTTVS